MIRNSICLIIVVIAFLFTNVAAVGQVLMEQPLGERLFDIEIRNKDFHLALGSLAKDHKIPIGIHATANPEPTVCAERFDLSFKRVTIGYILDSLVSRCSIYGWSINDEVINIQPTKIEPFLTDIQISYLEIKALNTSQIIDAIFQSKEVQSQLAAEELIRDTSEVIGSKSTPETYSFEFRDRSVRSILNTLIKETENRIWVFYKVSTDNRYVVLRVYQK